jgi:hypothetical protein
MYARQNSALGYRRIQGELLGLDGVYGRRIVSRPASESGWCETREADARMLPGMGALRGAAVSPVSVRMLSPCHVRVTAKKSTLAFERPTVVTFKHRKPVSAYRKVSRPEPGTGPRCRDERHLVPGGSGKRLPQGEPTGTGHRDQVP